MEQHKKGFNQSMDESSKDVNAFAVDLARAIKKHFGGKNSNGVGDEMVRNFTDPTKDPMSMKDEKGHFTVMYPPSSGQSTGSKTVDANTIRIDFWDGSVRIGESVQSNSLTKSLQMTGQESMQSLFIRVSKSCRLVIDGQGERIIAGDFIIRGIPIKAIELTSTDLGAFNFNLLASSNPKAVFSDESESFPIEKATVKVTQIAAATHFLSEDINPTNAPTYLKTAIALSQSGVLSAVYNYSGGSATVQLNGGSALAPNVLYQFDIPANVGDKINYQTSVAGTIRVLRVHETPEV